MTSLRRRLLAGTAAATIAIFVTAGVSLYLLERDFLISEFDAGLRTKVQAIASMTEFEPLEDRLDAEDALQIPEFQVGSNAEYFEIASDDGKHVVLSRSMQEKRFDRGSFAQRDTRAAFIRLPDGRAGRASILRARTQADPEQQLVQGPEITILVAKSSAALDRMLARLRLLLAAVCGLATIVMLAMCGWIVRAALRPVNALARQIGGIGADDLAERIQPPDVPRELCPIVSRLNELLAKLEGAFHRERAFTADAAHELRTPLSGLQTALEVCSREPREAPQYRRVVDDCLKVVHQMNAMVDNLLMLARADGNQIPAAREMTDVGELLRETWSRYQPTIEHRRVRVELQVQEGLVVRTDREKLAMILSNLLENASRYVNDSGRLTISALFADGSVKLAVANSGSKLRPGEIDHVFERFWRGDSSRSAAGRNCGLGLAVCRKLAAVLGASITAECADSDQFVVRVSLPGAIPSSQTLQAVCT